MALRVPIAAAMLRHRGVAISRIGQDAAAAELLRRLRALGVDVDHLQTDPDLATGRAVPRLQRGGDGTPLAWDNLQWDFDLSDVAQVADAVVFSDLGRRSGQARSTSDRFLAECRRALRVHDLTRRPASGIDRTRALGTLRTVEAAIVDDAALSQLLPGTVEAGPDAAMAALRRLAGLALVVRCEPGAPVAVSSAEGAWTGRRAHTRKEHEATIVGLLNGAIDGWTWPDAIALAERLAAHAAAHPSQIPPEEILKR